MIAKYIPFRASDLACSIYAALLWLLIGGFLPGCVNDEPARLPNRELIAYVNDATLSDRRRLSFLDEAQARDLIPLEIAEFGEALSQCLLSDKHSPVIRHRVTEVIIEDYWEDSAVWLAKALPLTREEEIRTLMLRQLELSGNKNTIIWLIKDLDNLSRSRPITLTPTYHLLKALAVKCLESELCLLFDDLEALEVLSMDSTKARFMILRVLNRLSSQNYVRDCLRGSTQADPLVKDLVYWTEGYGYLPLQMPLLLQGRWLRLNFTEELLEMLMIRSQRLSAREGYRFHCSDSHLLISISSNMLDLSGESLRTTISRNLDGLDHQKRKPVYLGAADDYSEDFSGRERDFSYTDLVRISLYLNNLKDEEMRKKLKMYVQMDLQNTESEVGGITLIREGDVHFIAFEPRERSSDLKYFLDLEMIQQSYDSLSLWHCHAFQDDNHPHAGPGVDDLDFLKRFQQSMLVISHVNNNSINVDYVSKDGKVVDLGVY
jgi:hypothetical protein